MTVHIHYTPQTDKMIDADAISSMKRGVRFINLARGEIVDDDAMLAAIASGRAVEVAADDFQG